MAHSLQKKSHKVLCLQTIFVSLSFAIRNNTTQHQQEHSIVIISCCAAENRKYNLKHVLKNSLINIVAHQTRS